MADPALPTDEGAPLSAFFEPSPRALVAKGTTVGRTCRTINAELTCPICLGLLHAPVVIRSCLHRFCSECIEKCLRIGRKECPSCRIHVPSRRSLRRDDALDALISKIYPNLEEYEEQEERLIEDLNKTRNQNNAFTESCRQGIQNQAGRRRTSRAADLQAAAGKRKSPPLVSMPTRKRANQNGAEDPNLVHYVLRKHPHDQAIANLEREYLRSSSDVQVMHMKKFLCMKLGETCGFEIIIVASGKGVVLDDDLSLRDVCQHFWDGRSDLILHYRKIEEPK